MSAAIPIAIRMETHSTPEPNTGCWLWTGCVNGDGYGLVNHGRRTMLAHRMAWILGRGQIPDGMRVLHRCDNPPCVNMRHLWLGTQKDNVQDCIRKGRDNRLTGDAHPSRTMPERRPRGDAHWTRLRPDEAPKGSRNGAAKLTENAVVAIREERAKGTPIRVLAARYGVSEDTAMHAANRQTWRHVP